MNILYLHGLESKLSPPKRQILQRFGKVYAPDLDYHNNENAIETILDTYKQAEIGVVIGSSMGGFAAYHVANVLDIPALLFNPALKKRSVPQNIPKIETRNAFKRLVMGQEDEVVMPQDTLHFLIGDFDRQTDFEIRLVPGGGHQTPVPLFEEEVEKFFLMLNR